MDQKQLINSHINVQKKKRMCLIDFLFPKFKDFLKNALIFSIFELHKCSLHKNGIEFNQKINGNVFVGLVRHPRELSGI